MRARGVMIAAVLGAIVFFAISPVVLLVGRSLLTAHAGIIEDIASEAGRSALLNTLRVAMGASALALVLATPIALLIFRTDVPFRNGLAVIFTMPNAIPSFIAAMGWIALASPKAGYLNRLFGEGTIDIYSLAGMIWVLGIAELPLVLLSARAALARVDSSLEEAARMSGAGPVRAMVGATLPLIWPALVSGAGLAFLSAASAFGVPYLLGVAAAPPCPVLTTRIYAWVLQGGQENLARAVGLCTVLLVLATGTMAATNALGRRGRAPILAGKGIGQRPLALGRGRWPLCVILMIVAGVAVILPILALFVTSVQRTFGAELDWKQLTLRNWELVLRDPRTMSATGTSLSLAAGAASLACLLGLAVALIRRHGGRWGNLTESVATWPYAVPGTVLALALIVAFSRDLRFILLERVAFVLALGDSLGILVVAYVARHLALAARSLSEGLAQIDPSLAEAARMSGAGPARAFIDATLPLLRPAVIAAFLLTFLLCATELTMSVLLMPPGHDLLGPRMFELQSYTDPASASVLASSFVLLVLATLAVVRLARQPRSA